MAEMTPMMKQYLQVKAENSGCILFYRLGDFYEMFFEDAKIASRELDLVLTGRDCGQEERAPMCGVPFHSYESYAAKLVAKGYKVAIVEQMEDPALAKGIVKRQVVRILTPGTVIEGSMLEEEKSNYLCSVYAGSQKIGLCFAEISTGMLSATEIDSNSEDLLFNEIAKFLPREILLNAQAVSIKGFALFIKDRICASVEMPDEEQFDSKKFDEYTFENNGGAALGESAKCAAAALLSYVGSTQINGGAEKFRTIDYYSGSQFMSIDLNSRRNLELTETMRSKEKRGSLLWVLDRTKTAMGKRLIRTWIEQPLYNCAKVIARHNAVSELIADSILRMDLNEILSGINDVERIITRIAYETANGKELRSLSAALAKFPELIKRLENVRSGELTGIRNSIDPLDDVRELIESSIVEDPPFSVREGGIIQNGYSAEVDELREDMNGGKDFIARIEEKERERTGIPKLKVGYNRVFGYYIEVLNTSRDKVPPEYIRKQTLTNCERYITDELKQLESRVLGASARVVALEYNIFDGIRKKIGEQLDRIRSSAAAVAKLDVLCSFAEVSEKRNYTCPQMSMDGEIILKDSRHPVIEAILDAPFVANDVTLDANENRVAIITGPNMAGKSTYMRQTALICIMAQIGCFVPARDAKIGLVDAIFTRVGASDDLTTGQSTFMVEMNEVAHILKTATSKSLLILDEIGRGTSTFDGMSIARSVLEFVADMKKLGAKTLFATHYHELTELEDMLDGVKNYNIAVKKHGDDITFLRRIIRGGADDSYGIEVAKLAGIPQKVITRAKQILKQLEEGQPVKTKITKKQVSDEVQLTMTSPNENEIMDKLRTIDVNTMTPVESMAILFELSKLAKNE